ncbi:MAG: hypothetical protein ACLTZY_02505 [Alistipes indistinctus]
MSRHRSSPARSCKGSAHTPVSDALRYFSGAQIKDYGGIGGLKTVNIRMWAASAWGILRRHTDRQCSRTGRWSSVNFRSTTWNWYPFITAKKSDIFQSARDFASASAVYMVTRRPAFESGRRNRFNVKLKGGSFDLINASALWEHRISENLSSSANIEYLNTSGKYKFQLP